MAGNDLKTEAFVLRRTNLGEADRLLDLLTPRGKITVFARSVRKEKSRLAGGIEMFCLSSVTIHENPAKTRNTLTSAKMQKFYHNILTDLSRLELASEILKKLSRAAEHTDSPEYFDLAKQSLAALDENLPPGLVAAWFYFNLVRARGEQINLISDVSGEKLRPDETYVWDATEAALKPLPAGRISANHIKIMRLMLSAPLSLFSRIDGLETYLPEVLHIAKTLNQL